MTNSCPQFKNKVKPTIEPSRNHFIGCKLTLDERTLVEELKEKCEFPSDSSFLRSLLLEKADEILGRKKYLSDLCGESKRENSIHIHTHYNSKETLEEQNETRDIFFPKNNEEIL